MPKETVITRLVRERESWMSRARRLNELQGSPTRKRHSCTHCKDIPSESAMLIYTVRKHSAGAVCFNSAARAQGGDFQLSPCKRQGASPGNGTSNAGATRALEKAGNINNDCS
eukprot:2525200-Pyramimonas_sp.AAC.1